MSSYFRRTTLANRFKFAPRKVRFRTARTFFEPSIFLIGVGNDKTVGCDHSNYSFKNMIDGLRNILVKK